MPRRNSAGLTAAFQAGLPDNDNNEISAADLRSALYDVRDSFVSVTAPGQTDQLLSVETGRFSVDGALAGRSIIAADAADPANNHVSITLNAAHTGTYTLRLPAGLPGDNNNPYVMMLNADGDMSFQLLGLGSNANVTLDTLGEGHALISDAAGHFTNRIPTLLQSPNGVGQVATGDFGSGAVTFMGTTDGHGMFVYLTEVYMRTGGDADDITFRMDTHGNAGMHRGTDDSAFTAPLDLHQISHFRLPTDANAPTSPNAGDAYYDSTLNALRVNDGTDFITLTGADGGRTGSVFQPPRKWLDFFHQVEISRSTTNEWRAAPNANVRGIERQFASFTTLSEVSDSNYRENQFGDIAGSWEGPEIPSVFRYHYDDPDADANRTFPGRGDYFLGDNPFYYNLNDLTDFPTAGINSHDYVLIGAVRKYTTFGGPNEVGVFHIGPSTTELNRNVSFLIGENDTEGLFMHIPRPTGGMTHTDMRRIYLPENPGDGLISNITGTPSQSGTIALQIPRDATGSYTFTLEANIYNNDNRMRAAFLVNNNDSDTLAITIPNVAADSDPLMTFRVELSPPVGGRTFSQQFQARYIASSRTLFLRTELTAPAISYQIRGYVDEEYSWTEAASFYERPIGTGTARNEQGFFDASRFDVNLGLEQDIAVYLHADPGSIVDDPRMIATVAVREPVSGHTASFTQALNLRRSQVGFDGTFAINGTSFASAAIQAYRVDRDRLLSEGELLNMLAGIDTGGNLFTNASITDTEVEIEGLAGGGGGGYTPPIGGIPNFVVQRTATGAIPANSAVFLQSYASGANVGITDPNGGHRESDTYGIVENAVADGEIADVIIDGTAVGRTQSTVAVGDYVVGLGIGFVKGVLNRQVGPDEHAFGFVAEVMPNLHARIVIRKNADRTNP